ncbi:pilus assembly protein PilP [Pseudomonas putida]|uniref:pilus assembly protein PilP n=1 Tax=Pseudomonas putida TaxID=303 RepID=UPI0023670E39|nr:pilus assembly protein PilP [Pseudomonas putida]MDD2048041.1 pilus assembly protein PilP [Pseudomonas putida]
MNVLAIARWQQWAAGSPLRQTLLLAGCLALLLGLAYIVHLRALFVEIEQGAEQSQFLRIEQAEKAAGALALATHEAQRAAAYQRLDEARWRLATGGELADLLEGIAYQGQSSGVFVEQVELLAEVLHDQHIEQPVQLQLQGSYPALLAFVHGLAYLPRLITLQDFSLLPTQSGLHLQVRLSAYRSRLTSAVPDLSGLAPEPVPAAPDITRNPFEPPPLIPHRQYLQTLPLDQFEMIGSLARGPVRFALLRVAGLVHRLQLGDRLGRDQGRVVNIEERQIEIAEQVFVPGKGWSERRRTLSMKQPAGAG